MDGQDHLVESPERIAGLLRSSKRIAVLGIKSEDDSGQPGYYVPDYLQRAGFEIIPVPVYYPQIKTILGQPVYRKLADILGDVDIVDVFRRPRDIPQHLPDILAKKPRAVWFQTGIRNDEAARTLAQAGIMVVQDRCMMVEHRAIRAP